MREILIKVCTFVQKVQHVEDEADALYMRENARDAPGRYVHCSKSEHDCSISELNPPISVVFAYHYYIIGAIYFPFSEQNQSSQVVLKASLVQLDQRDMPSTHGTPDKTA